MGTKIGMLARWRSDLDLGKASLRAQKQACCLQDTNATSQYARAPSQSDGQSEQERPD